MSGGLDVKTMCMSFALGGLHAERGAIRASSGTKLPIDAEESYARFFCKDVTFRLGCDLCATKG